MKTSFAIVSLLGCVGLAQTMACSGSPGADEPTAQSIDQGLTAIVPAGAKSKSHGIDHWTMKQHDASITVNGLDPQKASLVKIDVQSSVDKASGLRHFAVTTHEGKLVVTEKGLVLQNTLGSASRLAIGNLKEDIELHAASGAVAYDCQGDLELLLAAVGGLVLGCGTPEPVEPAVCFVAIVAVIGAWHNYQASCNAS